MAARALGYEERGDDYLGTDEHRRAESNTSMTSASGPMSLMSSLPPRDRPSASTFRPDDDSCATDSVLNGSGLMMPMDETPVKRPRDYGRRTSPTRRRQTDSPPAPVDLGNDKRFSETACRFLFCTDSENEEDKPSSPFAALNRQTNAGSFAKRSGPYARINSGIGSGLGSPADMIPRGSPTTFGGFALPIQPQYLGNARKYLALICMSQLTLTGWLCLSSIPRLGGGWIAVPLLLVNFLAARRTAMVLESFCYNHHGNLVATSYVDIAEAASGVGLRHGANVFIAMMWLCSAIFLYSIIVALLFAAGPLLVFRGLENIPGEATGSYWLDIRWYYGAVGGLLLLCSLGGLVAKGNVLRAWNSYFFNLSVFFLVVVCILLNVGAAVTSNTTPKIYTAIVPDDVTVFGFLSDAFPKSVTLLAWCIMGVILTPRLGTSHPFFARRSDALPVALERGGGERGIFGKSITLYGAAMTVLGLGLAIVNCVLMADQPKTLTVLLNFHRPPPTTTTGGNATPSSDSDANRRISFGVEMGLASVSVLVALHLVFVLQRCCFELSTWVARPPTIPFNPLPWSFSPSAGVASAPPSDGRLRADSDASLNSSLLMTPTPTYKHRPSAWSRLKSKLKRKLKAMRCCRCCCCCTEDEAELAAIAVQRRVGSEKTCTGHYFPILLRNLILPLAWFIVTGVVSYFFVCGTSAQCGTNLSQGVFDARPISKWIINFAALGGGLFVAPLLFGLPLVFDVVLQRRTQCMGSSSLPTKSPRNPDSHWLGSLSRNDGGHGGESSGGHGGGASGGNTRSSFGIHHWLSMPTRDEEDAADFDGSRCSIGEVVKVRLPRYGYRTYCVLVCFVGLVAAARVVAELIQRAQSSPQ